MDLSFLALPLLPPRCFSELFCHVSFEPMSEPSSFPSLSQNDCTALATFVVKRFRKYHASVDTASTVSREAPAASGSRSTFNVIQASSKAQHMPQPFDPQRYVRLAEPKHSLHAGKGVGKFFPKLPPNPRPGPLEPQFSFTPHMFALSVPGPQAPPPKATPRSLSFESVYGSSLRRNPATADSMPEPPGKARKVSQVLALPRLVEQVEFSTSQVQRKERMHKCVGSFMQCLSRASHYCALAQVLDASENPLEHAKHLLSHFAASWHA